MVMVGTPGLVRAGCALISRAVASVCTANTVQNKPTTRTTGAKRSDAIA